MPLHLHTRDNRNRLARWVGAMLTGMAMAQAVSAQTPGVDASTRHSENLQACQREPAGQDRETCLKEARNALAARQQGALATDTDTLQQNRLRRCEFQTGEARAACVARMSGRGSTRGDVDSGGILREVETVVIPPGSGAVVIEPKTADPVILVPDAP